MEEHGVTQREKINLLQSQLDKSNETIREMKCLLKDQRQVIGACSKQQIISYQQHKIIQEQRDKIRKLRLINFRSKQMIRKLKNQHQIAPQVQIKSETHDVKSEKPKYTQDDLKNAVQAVLGGKSLGQASAMFKVPRETLRQAKLKAQP